MSPAELLSAAKARGLDCIAVTDHNTVQGALQAVALAECRPFSAAGHPRHRGLHRGRRGHRPLRPRGHPRGHSRSRRPSTASGSRAAWSICLIPTTCSAAGRYRAASADARRRARRHRRGGQRPLARTAGRRQGARLAARLGKPGGAGSDAHRKARGGPGLCRWSRHIPLGRPWFALVAAGFVEHGLSLWEYALNWGGQALSPVTRIWRRVTGSSARGVSDGGGQRGPARARARRALGGVAGRPARPLLPLRPPLPHRAG